MSVRHPIEVGEFYHIYNRGVDKRVIFTTDQDHDRFQLLLYLCNSHDSVNLEQQHRRGRSPVDLWNTKRKDLLTNIGAYCLMPNHFHLLLHEREEGGISQFMKKLGTAYSMHFNTKYNRTGALFQGRYKSQHVDRDEYMKYLYAYIHLNPIKIIEPNWRKTGLKNVQGANEFLEDYQYSSYMDFIGVKRLKRKLLNTANFPKYFTTKKKFGDLHQDWLNYHE